MVKSGEFRNRQELKMKIETTLNMHVNIKERIEFASKRLEKSRTYIIRIILGKMLEDNKKLKRLWSPVKYQKSDLPENWSVFHLTLRQDEYEYCMDLRKVFRMSLSAIVAYGVDKYLDKILKASSKNKYQNNTDNYLYKNYIIGYELIDSIHTWRIYWGFTPKKLFEH
jgi:hypothetical protein